MKLRWVAVAGQLTTIAVVVAVLRIPVQLTPLIVALGVTAFTNFAFTLWLRSVRNNVETMPAPLIWHRVFMSLMVLDLVVLTLLLYFTGGHANPFGLFYFVNLTLSGILLPPSRAWLLNGLSVVCFACLFYYQVPLSELQQPESLKSVHANQPWTLGHRGLLVAFSACSAVIVYFVTRLNTELKRGDLALRQSQVRQASSEKWEALGTLSAGAAHELATPLSTIAIVSKEMQKGLGKEGVPKDFVDDVELIRRELDRCRVILDRMSVNAGHAIAEKSTSIDAESFVMATLVEMTDSRDRIEFVIAGSDKKLAIEIPLQSVCQATRALIQNGLDASMDKVRVNVDRDGSFLRITITDKGTGMTEDVLRRADEPFFTTKETGRGMGLGRFLARTIFERVGGTFDTESSVGVGTIVTVKIPIAEVSRV